MASAGLECPKHGDADRHGGGLVAFADQVQDAVSAEGVGVVLDPRGRGFRCAEGVDAEQVGQGAVVDGDGLGEISGSTCLVCDRPAVMQCWRRGCGP